MSVSTLASVDFEDGLSYLSGSRVNKLEKVSITYSMTVSFYHSLFTAEGRKAGAGAELPRGE